MQNKNWHLAFAVVDGLLMFVNLNSYLKTNSTLSLILAITMGALGWWQTNLYLNAKKAEQNK